MQAFSPLQPSLERYALHLTRNRYDARELVADTIAAVYERFDTITNKQALLSYVFTIATRIWNATKRHRNRNVVTASEQFETLFDSSATAEEQYDISLLYKAIAKLPEHIQQAVILFEIMGFSIQEIANIQECTEVSVKVRLHRARKKLRSLLGELQKGNPE